MTSRLFPLTAVCAAVVACAVATPDIDVVPPDATGGTANRSGDWPSYGLDLAETRFSPLTAITPDNVGRLGPVWSTPVGDGTRGQEGTLIASGGVLFGVTSWSVTFAVDARTGDEIWRWDPEVDQSIDAPGTDRICCGVVNRGVAVADGKVFVPVIDGRMVALDAGTGTPVWTAQATPEDDIAYSLTMAPRVVKHLVIVGNSGAEFPPYRGYFSAFDIDTGEEVWRFYTVPGDPSRPFENPALEAAAKTWQGEWWKYGGGGSVWDGLSYDAELDLLYVGTGNGAPWPIELRESARGMDNLYVASLLALDPDTAELAWHYQFVPGDEWDYDSTQQLTLADLTIDGQVRQVVMQANKNGFFYVVDRVTGEFISAEPFTRVSWTSGMDAAGRPRINPEAYYGTEAVSVMPSGGGAHNWAPMGFSPRTGLVYFPATLGGSFPYAINPDFEFTPGRMNFGLAPRGRGRGAVSSAPAMGPEGQGPHLIAWDPVTQTERWRRPGGGGGRGGVLATAGGVVLQVAGDGRPLAYDDETGEMLTDVSLGGRGVGPPVTYAVDGTQYVSLLVPGPPRIVTLALDGSAPLPGQAE